MLSHNHPVFVLSALCAALLATACNDSNATAQDNKSEVLASNSTVNSLVSGVADINKRNHVCFTMDVNNVKCVLGDIVAYVPQPILEEEQKEEPKADNKGKKAKKETAEEKAEKEAKAQIAATQNALNDARSLVFVAKYCDMERPVVYAKEGVSCTFKPHVLYDAGVAAEATQYQMNILNAESFFKEVAAIDGVEKFSNPAFGPHGGYRIFLKHSNAKEGMKIGADTLARIMTKRIDMEGKVLGFYQEELNFANLNPQMRILTEGLQAGDHAKLVFDTSLQDEQPLWRTSSLDFGKPYIWEVEVQSVSPVPAQAKPAK